MPKDETGTFFTEETKAKTTDTANPDVMGKWVGVAEKGINLIDQIVKMRINREPKTSGETGAYEKGYSQALQIAQAQQPVEKIIEVIKPAEIIIQSERAVEYLFEALSKTDGLKTLKEYIEGDLKEAKESGILKGLVEQFIKNFTELKQ